MTNTASDGEDLRVLSIQSHVVHGYVGNKSAVFPLQLSGFEVDFINSVQFSNHTGYGKWKGQVLDSVQLEDLYEGLRINDINYYTHILTGYCASDTFLNEVVKIVTELRQKNPNLFFICDPVMGDNGQYYVSKSLMPIYRDSLLPLADVITPNQFELEVLTNTTITTETDLLKAAKIIHNRGISTVVVSSTTLSKDQNFIIGYGSQNKSSETHAWRFEVQRVDAYFNGTGDLLTSLLLIWLQKTSNNLEEALQKTMSTLQDVLKRTVRDAIRKGTLHLSKPKNLELKLIQSRDNILNPQSTVRITRLT